MKNDKFSMRYTAPTPAERREIEDIRRRYADEPTASGLDRLRELDSKVKRLPTALGLTLGVVGTLLFGIGLTAVLEWGNYLVGVIVMLVACLPIAAAYPLYAFLLNRNKAKYSGEILSLADSLCNPAESTDEAAPAAGETLADD